MITLKNYIPKKPKEIKLIPGAYYRAVTIDGDIHDGILTYISKTKIELQSGNEFRSFSRGWTELRIVNLDCK